MIEEIGLNKHFKNERFSSDQIYQKDWSRSNSISGIRRSAGGLVRGWLVFANAFLVEAFLMLGAIISYLHGFCSGQGCFDQDCMMGNRR